MERSQALSSSTINTLRLFVFIIAVLSRRAGEATQKSPTVL